MKIPAQPPCTYQGSKTKFAARIARVLLVTAPDRFYDLCSGSGAVTIALVRCGVAASRITQVELGPWGSFYLACSEGTLDLDQLDRTLFCEWPRTNDVEQLIPYLASLSESPESFLVLQHMSLRGTPVSWRDGRVVSKVAGKYSVRPNFGSLEMRKRVFARARWCSRRLMGMRVVVGDVQDIESWRRPGEDSVLYLDPPYLGTAGYGRAKLDHRRLTPLLPRPLVVSEARRLPGARHLWLGRRKRAGGGKKEGRVSGPGGPEWLNLFGWPARAP